MDNENTTYTMTDSEKSFINGLVKSMRKEVFDYLVEVVKENAGLKADNAVLKVDNAVTKVGVVKYLCANREEVKDILETIDIDSDEVPDNVADSITDNWFSNAYTSDIIYKIRDNADLRDFVKDCIDEL